MTDHLSKIYERELDQLDRSIMEMGGLVEAQLAESLVALSSRNSRLAERIIADDARIDARQAEIDALVVRVLALRQPVAIDLRRIFAALRTSSELERMGDYAANIAKRTLALNQGPPVKALEVVPRMGRLVLSMLKDVLDAWTARDADRAELSWRRDAEVDALYNSLFQEVLLAMADSPSMIAALTHTLFTAKNIERIGDHVTNVAETVCFMVRGAPLTAARPKGDTTSFVADPDVARLKPPPAEAPPLEAPPAR